MFTRQSKSRKSVLIGVVAVLFSGSLLLGGLTAYAGPAPAPKFSWDMPTNIAPGDEYFLPILRWMVDEVGKRTNGDLKIHFRYLGELGVPDIELPRMLKQGTLETTFVPVAMFLDLPWASVDILPFLVRDADQGAAVAKALRPLFIPWFRESGYEFLPMNYLNFSGCLWSNKPIPTIASMKGIKVRTTGPHIPKLAAEWGMEPTTVDPTELYLAMQRGVVDAAFAGHYWGMTVKMYEVAKYVNLWNYCYWHTTWVINSQQWNKLPAKWQKMIIEDIAPEISKRAHAAQIRQDKENVERDKQRGLTVIQPSADELTKAADGGLRVAQKWAEKVGDKGHKSLAAMLEALKLPRK